MVSYIINGIIIYYNVANYRLAISEKNIHKLAIKRIGNNNNNNNNKHLFRHD